MEHDNETSNAGKKEPDLFRTEDPAEYTAGPATQQDELPIPASPVIHAALRALYAGGTKHRWESDAYGHPHYRYQSRDGFIVFSFAPAPDFGGQFHPSIAMYYKPRLGFIYTGRLRDTIRNLSVETADVFLILMARIAQLRDPERDIARISLDEISRLRNVRVRHGSTQTLYEDFKQEVLRLADLRLFMTWRDYTGGGTITFGKERPDRLLDILDVEHRKDRDTWRAFRFRSGQALAHFLNPEGLRWIGYYSKSLLQLSPYHEGFTKKLGTYWIMVGTAAGKKGAQPRATPKTILDFCGEYINWRNPGQTVDSFIEAHERLEEIGVLESLPVLEPPTRSRGYFRDWLETALTVKLSESLWRISDTRERARRSPQWKRKAVRKKKSSQQTIAFRIPETPAELQKNPKAIRQFRSDHLLHQDELARTLGVTRQTLSHYERALRPLPENKAVRILQLWRQKALS